MKYTQTVLCALGILLFFASCKKEEPLIDPNFRCLQYNTAMIDGVKMPTDELSFDVTHEQDVNGLFVPINGFVSHSGVAYGFKDGATAEVFHVNNYKTICLTLVMVSEAGATLDVSISLKIFL